MLETIREKVGLKAVFFTVGGIATLALMLLFANHYLYRSKATSSVASVTFNIGNGLASVKVGDEFWVGMTFNVTSSHEGIKYLLLNKLKLENLKILEVQAPYTVLERGKHGIDFKSTKSDINAGSFEYIAPVGEHLLENISSVLVFKVKVKATKVGTGKVGIDTTGNNFSLITVDKDLVMTDPTRASVTYTSLSGSSEKTFSITANSSSTQPSGSVDIVLLSGGNSTIAKAQGESFDVNTKIDASSLDIDGDVAVFQLVIGFDNNVLEAVSVAEPSSLTQSYTRNTKDIDNSGGKVTLKYTAKPSASNNPGKSITGPTIRFRVKSAINSSSGTSINVVKDSSFVIVGEGNKFEGNKLSAQPLKVNKSNDGGGGGGNEGDNGGNQNGGDQNNNNGGNNNGGGENNNGGNNNSNGGGNNSENNNGGGQENNGGSNENNTTAEVKLNLALSFQGIVHQVSSKRNKMSVKVGLRKKGENNIVYKEGEFTSDSNAVWHGSVNFCASDLQKINFTSGGHYIVYVKGPKHIQKKVCVSSPSETYPGSYHCVTEGNYGEGIVVKDGDNLLNFSKIKMLAGDLPVQDGIVNSYDISLVRNLLGKTDEHSLSLADINLDGIVDTQDYSLVQAALAIRYDEM